MPRSESQSSARPAIRAVQPQSLLASIAKVLPPAEATALYTRLGSEAVEEIHSALMLSWVPLELHMRLSVTVMEHLGHEPFVELYQRTFERSLDSAMLRGLFGSLRRLSQDSIHTLFKNGPRMYGYIVRGAGVVRYERAGERMADLTLEGWPTQYSTLCWALGTQGCLRAMLGAAHGGGEEASNIDLVGFDEDIGQITYRATWS